MSQEKINTFVFPIVRPDFILPALRSLRKETPDNYKVIVVNMCAKFPDHNAMEYYSDIVINTSTNYGFAQGANLGTRLATTPAVTICNDDVLFLPGWWQGIERTFQQFDNAIGVAPMSPKEPGWGYGEDGFRVHAEFHEVDGNPAKVHELIKERDGQVVDGIAMWCVTLKRKPWVQLGMFDERFFPGGGEDYDANSRAYKAGYRMLSTSYSWVWHHWGKSKDEPGGLNFALKPARKNWNKLSTKGFGAEGLWDPDCDVWGKTGERTDNVVMRMPL